MRHLRVLGVSVAMLLTVLPVQDAAHAAGCGPSDHPGGDWTSLNHDLSNTRHQDQEGEIDLAAAADLTPAWRYSAEANGTDGSFQSTPIVADGCVFASSSTGWVISLNADTGDVVWKTQLEGNVLGLAVKYGLVYAFPYGGDEGPHAVALDQATGAVVWRTGQLGPSTASPDGTSAGTDINASPVVFDDMVFVPLSLAYGEGQRVPLYLLNAHDGTTIERFFALPEKDYELGYSGAGIWSTAAVDTEQGYLYAGTADSESFKHQHRYNNAILKIDVDPDRATFAQVVDAYQATQERYVDEYVPGLRPERNPICDEFGGPDDPLGGTSTSSSNACGELDVDFGASPNLYVDSEGNQMVGEMQKSGVYHAVFADNMEQGWRRIISSPGNLGNGSTSAFDGENIYAAANPGTVFSFFGTDGWPNWASHTGADAVRYQPMTVANGVLYTIGNGGALVAMDAATGRPVLNRPVSMDVDRDMCVSLGGGVSVARNTVYAPCGSGGWIVAYR